jgi:hypothetical protein
VGAKSRVGKLTDNLGMPGFTEQAGQKNNKPSPLREVRSCEDFMRYFGCHRSTERVQVGKMRNASAILDTGPSG